MDKNVKLIQDLKIKRTIDNLSKNQMNGYYVESLEELHSLVKSLLQKGDLVSVGGSRTLFESGIIDLLRSGEYDFLDRYADGLTTEDIKSLYRKSFSANAYFMSSNALTEDGELYNVDGTGNRVAALAYGPDKVIVIVGINKLVRNLQAAINRNRQIAAPVNCMRLSMNTPCSIVGECKDCKTPDRVCCHYLTTGFQRVKDRVHVIIVNDHFGF